MCKTALFQQLIGFVLLLKSIGLVVLFFITWNVLLILTAALALLYAQWLLNSARLHRLKTEFHEKRNVRFPQRPL